MIKIELGFTTLFATSVLPLLNTDLFRSAYTEVSSERRKKIDSYRFDKDKRLSLGAEMLLNYALRDISINPDSVRIVNNPMGKPLIDNSNIHFNISHSGDWVICAISDNDVGCDIEKIDKADLNIAEHFFCKDEYLHIAEQTLEDNRNTIFYRYWTLKESFIKNIGLGLNIPLNSFLIELNNQINIHQNYDCRNYHFKEYNDIRGYCCAVCSLNEISQMRIIDIIKKQEI